MQESHKPRTWKTLKKRRRKERGEAAEEPTGEAARPRRGCWVTNIIPLPEDPEAYAEDDSVRFHRPMEVRQTIVFLSSKNGTFQFKNAGYFKLKM